MTRAGIEWTPQRIARLGFLVGLGWDGHKIATEFSTEPNNIYRQSNRFELSFLEARRIRDGGAISLAALRRGITPDVLVDRVIAELEKCPVLIDNILDDDVAKVA